MGTKDKTHFACSGCGRVELSMTLEDAQSAAHQGKCDEDVKALSQRPDIAAQLAKIDPIVLMEVLGEYGAWEPSELSDHEANLQRILWSLACDITEQEKS